MRSKNIINSVDMKRFWHFLHYKKSVSIVLILLSFHCGILSVSAEIMPGSMGIGMPVGQGDDSSSLDMCPRGSRTVNIFLSAWKNKDYRTMYEQIDDRARKDYPYEQARFDFQFMEFRPYRISSVSRSGDDFEFVISCGNWRDGDKDVKKVYIKGDTFKIKMPSRNSVFKESVENYF
ncbi:MAG: hypothetical protein GF392_03010 [Candidatus Omnitrophica bacterium]|nr:hypothetical protein [Candidatus Omnitrophota bacterium]